jgi:hypothetical protein
MFGLQPADVSTRCSSHPQGKKMIRAPSWNVRWQVVNESLVVYRESLLFPLHAAIGNWEWCHYDAILCTCALTPLTIYMQLYSWTIANVHIKELFLCDSFNAVPVSKGERGHINLIILSKLIVNCKHTLGTAFLSRWSNQLKDDGEITFRNTQPNHIIILPDIQKLLHMYAGL